MDACRRSGALLIADEVQSGLGRTGYPFYFGAIGLKPHLVSSERRSAAACRSVPR